METFDAWAVAAAILARGNEFERELHYRTLADKVVAAKLTTLGLKGKEPAQTLGAILRKHTDVFGSKYRAYYYLVSPEDVASIPVVARAIKGIEEVESRGAEVQCELSKLRTEVKRLRERNALLERRMAEIAEICTDLGGLDQPK